MLRIFQEAMKDEGLWKFIIDRYFPNEEDLLKIDTKKEFTNSDGFFDFVMDLDLITHPEYDEYDKEKWEVVEEFPLSEKEKEYIKKFFDIFEKFEDKPLIEV